MKKYNINKVIEKLKQLYEEGKEVRVILSQNNGRRTIRVNGESIGLGEINSFTYETNGVIEEIIENTKKDNPLHTQIDVGGWRCVLLSVDSKEPCYQSGIALVESEGEIIYSNPYIMGSKDRYVYSVADVFDDESLIEIYSKMKDNPYNDEYGFSEE